MCLPNCSSFPGLNHPKLKNVTWMSLEYRLPWQQAGSFKKSFYKSNTYYDDPTILVCQPCNSCISLLPKSKDNIEQCYRMINLVENSAIHSREPRLTFIESTQLTKENPTTCVCYYIMVRRRKCIRFVNS